MKSGASTLLFLPHTLSSPFGLLLREERHIRLPPPPRLSIIQAWGWGGVGRGVQGGAGSTAALTMTSSLQDWQRTKARGAPGPHGARVSSAVSRREEARGRIPPKDLDLDPTLRSTPASPLA